MFTADATLDAILRGAILSSLSLLWVILLIRLNGLRSLSKMTNFDFIMTVAMGSLVAGGSQVTEWTDFLQVAISMVALFAFQHTVARLRKASSTFEEVIQNEPILLMRNGVVLEEGLRKSRVSQDDLLAKLREANVLRLSDVRAVVLETTGDVSVLHGKEMDKDLIRSIRSPADS